MAVIRKIYTAVLLGNKFINILRINCVSITCISLFNFEWPLWQRHLMCFVFMITSSTVSYFQAFSSFFYLMDFLNLTKQERPTLVKFEAKLSHLCNLPWDEVSGMVKIRAGMIQSAADTIRIRYWPCWYNTYSIQYTCTLLKVSKSRILDFNNKVNVFGWSIQWIQQITVLKRNDHLCSVYRYHSFIHKVHCISLTYLRSNSICLSLLLNCMKVKTNSVKLYFQMIQL